MRDSNPRTHAYKACVLSNINYRTLERKTRKNSWLSRKRNHQTENNFYVIFFSQGKTRRLILLPLGGCHATAPFGLFRQPSRCSSSIQRSIMVGQLLAIQCNRAQHLLTFYGARISLKDQVFVFSFLKKFSPAIF